MFYLQVMNWSKWIYTDSGT